MPLSQLCPSCGQPIPADGPLGLCPRCLLNAGRVPPVVQAPTQSQAARHFTAPSVNEIAAHFPHLEIRELLGQGGMGAVYKARQPSLDRFVALKILPPAFAEDPTFSERFAREARVLARLNHPNIVAIHDSGRAGQYYYLLMEYVDGVTLRDVMRSGTLTPNEALALVPQICEALQFAHEEGVVHRDIKPENVLLDRRGRVKVADFGLAKLAAGSPEDYGLTATHQVMGTPRYMAPEQLEGAHSVDHRADIYSLGVVFYELLTGELPLGRFAPPSRRAQVDARLDRVVLRTLEKEPDRRYQHASEIKTEIDSLHPQRWNAHQYAGHEYRSPIQIAGWPLIHIARGIDPATGRPRTARGLIAIGGRAIGGLAIGGLACGVITIGGVTCGLFSLGGVSLGLIMALGGCALSSGVAVGGAAIGTVALGGAAIGWFGMGGAVAAWHSYGATGRSPEALNILRTWLLPGLRLLGLFALAAIPGLLVAIAAIVAVSRVADRNNEPAPMMPDKPPAAPRASSGLGPIIFILFGLLLAAGLLVVILSFFWSVTVRQSPKLSTPQPIQQYSNIAEEPVSAAVDGGWIMGSDGPEVSPVLVSQANLTSQQVDAMNRILRETWDEYLKLETVYKQREIDNSGRVQTVLTPSQTWIGDLEHRFWIRVDSELDPEQQKQAHRILRLYSQQPQVGSSLDDLVQPGLLGWGEHVVITVRPIGSWYEYSIERQGLPKWVRQGDELPPMLQRFAGESIPVEQ